ncbi:MAG TPA: HEAT repeat domain-containing protein [Blastocatellia bacterium]|nr:HEAT repeat domain-containing protein [Blastocatellia bacterium]
MQLVQPTKALALLLILLLSIPQSLLAQKIGRAPQRPPRVAEISSAINDLLKEHPVDSTSADDEEHSAADNDDSEHQEKPPADDAPIEKLIAYWVGHSYSDVENDSTKPTEKVRERLLEAFENRPWMSPGMINLLPDTQDTHDRLYKLLTDDPNDLSSWKNMIRMRLKQNSSYFREELLSDVRNLGKFNYSDLSSLRALIKLDWETAKPVAEDMARSPLPHIAAEAQMLIYEQACRSNDSAQAEALRAQLKAIVMNRLAPPQSRQTALDSLLKTEWSGREEWYVSLFSDPSLSGVRLEEKKADEKAKADAREGGRRRLPGLMMDEETGMNLLWTGLLNNDTKLISAIMGLLNNGERAVHLAAVSCLTQFVANSQEGPKELRLQIARAMLPWLSQPDWGGEMERWAYIDSLSKLDIPECLPGLIWVLDYDPMPENRATAARSLIQYKSPQAIPALRRALNREGEDMLRQSIIHSLAKLGGFTDAEAASAIEAYCRRVLTEDGRSEIQAIREGSSEKKLPLEISIGAVYAENEELDISDSLATLLFNRAKALRKTQPELARKILSIAHNSSGIVADLNLVDCIAEGWVDIEMLKLAFESRVQLRKNVGDKLDELLKLGGYQTGLAAAILEEEDNRLKVLNGRDTNAQLALLAAARYMREKLPVELVGKLLNAGPVPANPAVKTTAQAVVNAAESYLESEDSTEARKLVWARHPGEAKILGEQFYFNTPPGVVLPVNAWEEKMRKEVLSTDGPEEVYAVVPSQNPEVFNSIIVRVRKGASGPFAEISLQQAEGRRQIRTLTSDELQELKDFTSREDVENIRTANQVGEPMYAYPGSPAFFEYLRLTKDGGRRIKVAQVRRAPKKGATLQEQLGGLFYRLSRTGEFKLRYVLEDKIPGVEVLVAEDKRQVYSICQEGGQLSVMVSVENAEPNGLAERGFEWRSLVDGRLGAPIDEPANCQSPAMLWNRNDWIREMRMTVGAMFDPKAKLGNVWFAQANPEGEPGIWKFEEGHSPIKVAAGIYGNLVVTPDSKWLIAKKTIQTEDNFESRLVRIQLPSGREFPINATQANDLFPVSYVAAHNKFLLSQYQFQYRPDSSGSTFYLLDAETGVTQVVRGEFRPLVGAIARPLQATDKPNEFWAALYDTKKKATAVGRYDLRTFNFTPVVELPELRLNSSDTWADAKSGKLYFVYLGHLLRIPLGK